MRKVLLVSAIALCLANLGSNSLGKEKDYCDDSLVPNKDIAGGSLKYDTRDDNRCEGYYLKPHSQPPIALVSLMGKYFSKIPEENQMHLRWAEPGSEQISDTFIQVNSMVNGFYYRMDTKVDNTRNFFDWPLDLVKNNGQKSADNSLGYQAWFKPDEDSAERVFLPLSNAPLLPDQSPQDSLFYPITGYVYCRVEIDELRVQIIKKNSDGKTLIHEKIFPFKNKNTYEKAVSFLLDPGGENWSGKKLLRIDVRKEPDRIFIHPETYYVQFPEKN